VAETIDASPNTVGSVREDMDEIYDPQIFNKDCRDLLNDLDDSAVDCIIADPPYGIQFSGNRYNTASADQLEGDSDHDVIQGLADELYRVLKDDRHAYVFCRYDSYPAFVEEFAGPFELDTVIVWDKDDGGHGMGDLDDFAPRHEWILKLSKGDRPVQTEKRKPNVIRHQDARFTADEKHHSTQKPIGLIEELLEASTQEEEVVFDPFGGVYTTARATVPMARKCVSTEIDTDYHATGREAVKRDLEQQDDGNTLIYETEVV
jgi:site-specific DNA-methyltransferase (adenine-specific)